MTGGVPPYSFLWNPNVSTTNVATGLGAGNYTITVTDGMGCSKIISITINHTPAVSLTTVGFPDTCQRNVGAAKVTVNSGTPPFSYQWNPTGNTSAVINNLSAGSYTITVTDSEGCTDSENVFIDIVGSFTFNLGNDTYHLQRQWFYFISGKFCSI